MGMRSTRLIAAITALAAAPAAALTVGPTLRPAAGAAQRTSGRVRAVAELVRADSPPAIGTALPDCPPTIWDADEIDIEAWQKQYREEGLPVCPIEIHATEAANAAGAAWFVERREELKATLEKHGTIWFRGFELMKDADGFRSFWESLDLDPCLDPLHTSGLRKFLSKDDALYEEVNKESLSKHYIGLHNESTFKKTAKAGAFVCFKPATGWGGEFFIADGEAIFRDLDPEVLREIMRRKVRISVSNLDFDLLDKLPPPQKEAAMRKLEQMVADGVAPKFDMDLEMLWGTDGRAMRLQAVQNAQSPVNRHPATGRPAWFCNLHNQARFLRERRPCGTPEVGMTDIYFGDLSLIPGEMLQHINEVSEKNIVTVPMQPGEVLLCDNYRVLHGRDIFDGDRLHAVSWFGDEKLQDDSAANKPGDLLNVVLNSAF
ncbi:hypothetical protein EMIHUDRAFT_440046 [Emiliania huxleyi CCMP1516]|uniref:TauD/TfdA-like domain-containing protein n=2 Tax=Emiliania huxleyi TaxID=2903 RepID=A0A0D3KSS9_EMIH1|nr:hypothetical protein EMIHUDRAFT_440046 [Emiliania huxleyi CCMP1516]EOD38814.1 hypothetical protein EMIHUDRAFT_440046 [Emiliania huxleyi CCMP1516]|eukprot:XP_005791243.1 hypothetical protein EMIHUDRAFT_440046 [Emiliania huxleyi CCMP1516]